MIKQYKGCIIFFYIAAFISLAVASFQDLQIDIALNNPESPFAIWFWKTAEMPSNVIFMFGGLILFRFAQKRILNLLGLVAELGGGVFLGIYMCDYFFIDDGTKTLTGALFGLGTAVSFLIIGMYITVPDKAKKPLAVFAIAGMVAMLIKTGATEITKIFWGRERMRMLIEEGSYDNFTPWYKPQGITSSNEYKSFPSGHTSGAGMSYLAMLLPFASDKLRSKWALCFAVPFAYTSVVAFSRLMMGAHFLSDVTVGGIIAFTCVVIVMAVLDKKNEKLGLNK